MKKVESRVVYRVVLPADTIIESESFKSIYLATVRELRSYIHGNKKDGHFILEMVHIYHGISYSIETRPGYFEGDFIEVDEIGIVAVGATKSGRIITNYVRR